MYRKRVTASSWTTINHELMQSGERKASTLRTQTSVFFKLSFEWTRSNLMTQHDFLNQRNGCKKQLLVVGQVCMQCPTLSFIMSLTSDEMNCDHWKQYTRAKCN